LERKVDGTLTIETDYHIMKTIGLLGGMSWESTVSYYKAINEGVKARLGGLHSAKILLYSVDFQEIEILMRQGQWDAIADILTKEANRIASAGADFLLICTNTMHIVFPQIEAAVDIPLLHIADAAANVIQSNGCKQVGLLGTAATMEEPFYKDRLLNKYGIGTVVPEAADRRIVHTAIFNELCLGKIEDRSRTEYLRIIENLGSQGAEAVILGCTEIAMLVSPNQTSVPLLDTAEIHAQQAVEMALS
jgi:aspartate racemase